MLKNKIWIIQFLLRKKCSWYVGIILIMYFNLIPYQINLIEFFESKENAKNLFWKSAYLYHNVFVLTFVFFSSMQLLNSEMREIFAKEKKQIVSILLGIFGIYQLIVLPIYIWYLMIYLDEFKNIVVMLTFEIVYICIYIILAWLCKKTLVVYILLFLLALLIFR